MTHAAVQLAALLLAAGAFALRRFAPRRRPISRTAACAAMLGASAWLNLEISVRTCAFCVCLWGAAESNREKP